jgi:Carboxypeptidase regulatory-like domain
VAENETVIPVTAPATTEASIPTAAPVPSGSFIPGFASVLRQPLSTVQTVVGIVAGLLTIGGGFFSFSGFAAPNALPQQGEIVAVVQDVRTSKPLSHATVEIFTPQDAIVTTLDVEPDGHLARRLKEGQYRLRVTHPGFLTEVRHIEVHAGQRSDFRIAMGPRPPAPRVMKTVVVEQPGPVQKFFREVFGQ